MESRNSDQIAFSPYVDLGHGGTIFDSTYYYEGRYYDQFGYEKDPPSKPPRPPISVKEKTHSMEVVSSVDHVDWNHFTKSTTFHGMKYVFDKHSVKLRRSVWFFSGI